jgi:hypothetical protein
VFNSQRESTGFTDRDCQRVSGTDRDSEELARDQHPREQPPITTFMFLHQQELDFATRIHGNFNSAHEAYGVLLEEVDEFWDEVRKNSVYRNKANMLKELTQISAMAHKAALSLKLCEH